jgi:hypothetical protein
MPDDGVVDVVMAGFKGSRGRVKKLTSSWLIADSFSIFDFRYSD